jgi:2-keto-4-pentenoate hydratase
MDRAGEAARLVWSAWRKGRRLERLPDACRPATLAEGHAAQAALAALAGEAIGWKIAATSEAGQRHIGVSHPLAGRLFARFAVANGATLDAGPMHMRVAEPELAFRFGRDLPPREHDYTRAEVLDTVAALHLAIEVPDSRIQNFASAGAPQLLADDACAGFFVLGPAVPDWRSLDLPRQPAAIAREDDGRSHEGSGANVLGDPVAGLVWLVNDCRSRGVALRAGEIVTTGTCAKPMPIEPGARVTANFAALGSVHVRFG